MGAQNVKSEYGLRIYLNNEFLNKSSDTVSKAKIRNQVLNKIQIETNAKSIKKAYPNSKTAKLRNVFEIKIKSKNVDSLINVLKRNPAIEKIKKDTIIKALSCSNPTPPLNDTWMAQGWVNNYALEMINYRCAWSITTGSSDQIIAIADTDFDINHKDLDSKFYSVTGPISAKHPHGTHVSGLVAPETNNNQGIGGIGYETMMAGYRVYHWGDGLTSGSDIKDAIWNAYQDNRSVINVSWSGTGLDTSAAEEIVDNGTVLVLAAGNSPSSTNHSDIADIPGVINISGVNWDNEHGPTGHAHNQWVDLCAPSKNVSTTKHSDSSSMYGGGTGTSYAAPIVSGTIGLMLDVNDQLQPAIIEEILKTTTDPIDDASSFPNEVGTGRLNSYCAVYRSLPLDINGDMGGTYKNYFVNINDAVIQSNTTVKAAEAEIQQNFEVQEGVEFEIVKPVSFTCQSLEINSNILSYSQYDKSSWSNLSFNEFYQNPVIIMGPLSYNDYYPATIRVKNITSSSCEYQIDEWNYLDGYHATEDFSFMVMENGNHTFEGLKAEAGIVESVSTYEDYFSSHQFSQDFSQAPVVFAQLIEENGNMGALTVRIKNITSSSMEVRLDAEESENNPLQSHNVAFIAVEPGITENIEVGRTDNSVTHDWYPISFTNNYTSTPSAFIGHIQTYDGSDPVSLRYDELTSSGIYVKCQEEQSADDETSHTTEVVGYMVIK